ncbi:MAG: Na+/H+ antiporter NhaC family protein [Bacteroidales bacterium]|nr:Na+/H+ antiporter NhaC family protein [Bacteroidales bacterium]
MAEYGFLSILPPVLAIILALKTKQVYSALVFGTWLAWLILNDWNIIDGTIATIEGYVNVFNSPGNTRTIMFSALVGALLLFIQYSGGVEGFMNGISKLINFIESKRNIKSRVFVQLLALATGMLLFVETSISSLTVGTLYRPLFDKLKIPREKLAYIADSSSAPSSILVPFNAWGAFIMGLLITQGVENPISVLAWSIFYNFYPILTIILVFIVIVSKKDIGSMAKAERRTRETGQLHGENARPMVSDSITSVKSKEGIKIRAINMYAPLLTMVLMMPVYLSFTGWDAVKDVPGFFNHAIRAIGSGSGSSAVLYSVITSLIVAMVLYRSQKIMRTQKMIQLILKGISELMPLALLMMLAFSLSDVSNKLGTGVYVATQTKEWLSPALLPFIIFIISSFIAFSTGTSWGTFAIMMAISIPMVNAHGGNIFLVVAATTGGGVFGDHCSPISDTTIISSMASASDHIDHVKTQLPYALLAGSITAVLYLILGYLM